MWHTNLIEPLVIRTRSQKTPPISQTAETCHQNRKASGHVELHSRSRVACPIAMLHNFKTSEPKITMDRQDHTTYKFRAECAADAHAIPAVLFQTPYATPPGAQERTFELTVASIYELWLVCTFTGWFGEEIWTSPPLPFRQLDMKLTFKEKTLTYPDFRWLLERVFRLQRGSETLRCAEALPSDLQEDCGPSKFVLDTLAQKVHLYLAAYDLSALLGDAAATEHLTSRVLNKAVPTTEEGLDTHEAYLQVCFDCVRLTYIDEASYLAAPVPSSCGQKG